MLPMPLEEDHVAAVELKTMVPEDYAKFYNHGPFTKTFSWLKATNYLVFSHLRHYAKHLLFYSHPNFMSTYRVSMSPVVYCLLFI